MDYVKYRYLVFAIADFTKTDDDYAGVEISKKELLGEIITSVPVAIDDCVVFKSSTKLKWLTADVVGVTHNLQRTTITAGENGKAIHVNETQLHVVVSDAKPITG